MWYTMKIKMALFAIFSLTLLSSAVFAVATPGVPHQFFGSVTINGAPAPDGTTVSAKIGSSTVSTTTTFGGKYGYSPRIVYVNDPNGDRYGSIIRFFVNDVYTGATASYSNGKSTQVDLAVTISTPPPNNPPPSGGGGGSGGGSTPTVTQAQTTTTTSTQQPSKTTTTSSGPCVEKWTCTEWSKCDGSLEKRTCKDANKCGTIDELLMTSQPCSLYEETQKFASSGSSNGITGRVLSFATGSGAPIVGGIIVVGLAGYYFMNRKSGAKKKKGYKYN